MPGWTSFVIGVWVGTVAGVLIMCLMTASSRRPDEAADEDDYWVDTDDEWPDERRLRLVR